MTFDRAVRSVFVLATATQVILGIWRARLIGSSIAPALALAGVIAAVGLLWHSRRSGGAGRSLAQPAALLLATIGALSTWSALNAPLISFASRFSTPLFAFTAAAIIVAAEQPPRLQFPILIAFVIALALLELALTKDARWETRSATMNAAHDGRLRIASARHRE